MGGAVPKSVGMLVGNSKASAHAHHLPKYAVGDRLWVKETFVDLTDFMLAPLFVGRDKPIAFRADNEFIGCHKWKPSIFMPRTASRITLTVTDVRVERLQDISRGDAMDEGCPFPNMANGPDPRHWYSELWNSINGDGAWEKNPWVAAYSFTVHLGNIDEVVV